jgi:hypothetical protein
MLNSCFYREHIVPRFSYYCFPFIWKLPSTYRGDSCARQPATGSLARIRSCSCVSKHRGELTVLVPVYRHGHHRSGERSQEKSRSVKILPLRTKSSLSSSLSCCDRCCNCYGNDVWSLWWRPGAGARAVARASSCCHRRGRQST